MTITPTEQAVTQALLPCPFCGGEAHLDIGKNAFEDVEVSCLSCGIQGPNYDDGYGREDNRRLAISAWNTRATPPTTPARVDEARAREIARIIDPSAWMNYDALTTAHEKWVLTVKLPADEVIKARNKQRADEIVEGPLSKARAVLLALATEATGRSEADVRGEALEEAARVADIRERSARVWKSGTPAADDDYLRFDGAAEECKAIAAAIRALAEPARGGCA